jgi:hypothetical protein
VSATQRPVTREDRVQAVWRGFRRVSEEGRFDVLLPLAYRMSRRDGFVRSALALPLRWHMHLRPWLYPDPCPWPRFRLWGRNQ